MKKYIKRVLRLLIGLFLYALGSFLTIQASIGLAPWEAFSTGVSNITYISYGNIVVLSGLVIVGIDYLLKEKIGFGTILNAILIGTFVDVIQFTNIIPVLSNFWLGILMLIVGLIVICVGSYLYIGTGLGCGPRDALMVALGKRATKLPIGIVRALIEASVLSIGWLLGAPIGLGTIISVFGIGIILQGVFKLLHFEVTNVIHESIPDTIKKLQV
jgi:uncharacterized membrane protein YczE